MPALDFAVFNHILKGVKKATRENYTAYDSYSGEWATVPAGFGATTTKAVVAGTPAAEAEKKADTITTASASIISILLAITAAYLSWSCDYTSGGNFPLKVLQTVVAALFGSLYIVFHIIFLMIPCEGLAL